MEHSIKINEIILDRSVGFPTTFYGPLSGKTLPGIDLAFSQKGRQNIEAIEHLFNQETVQVDDPFTGQSYQASLELRSSSYQGEGLMERNYNAELRALDLSPEFSILEINGNSFPVLATREDVISEGDREGIFRRVLLQLTPDQFSMIQQYFKYDTLSVKRVGIDEQPMLARQGSLVYWSRHKQGDMSFYKQIVSLVYPADFPSSDRPQLALDTDQRILLQMVQALTARFEALTNELTEKGLIHDDKQRKILGENWQELLDPTRIDEFAQQTRQVPDAEIEL